jgi:hypothetical protein
MIHAILSGTKTQTRRIMKPQPSAEWCPQPEIVELHNLSLGEEGLDHPLGMGICNGDGEEGYVSKYGIPGDRLWVRETFRLDTRDGQFFYCASSFHPERFSWKPSIFMPRKASRITLEITGVRVERLNDISDLDACAEGADGPHPTFQAGDVGEDGPESFIAGYREIWETINGVNSWEKNPWVWVLEFRKTT